MFQGLKTSTQPWSFFLLPLHLPGWVVHLFPLFGELSLPVLPLPAPAPTEKHLFFYSHWYGKDQGQVVAISLRLPATVEWAQRVYKKERYLASMLEHNGSPIRPKLVLWESQWESVLRPLCESALTPQMFPSSREHSFSLSCAQRESCSSCNLLNLACDCLI